MKIDQLKKDLDVMIPNPVCELNYSKDYELLIAVVLSAQCTDKRVNMVTEKLFKDYDLESLSKLEVSKIEKAIHSLGNSTKRAVYIKEIATRLIEDYEGKVPNNRAYLESLPGVGRKTCNVVLSELFNVPTMAVDTHVERVSKRLGLANEKDNVQDIETKLMKKFAKEDYNKVNHQLLLLGRYTCLAKNPNCENCQIQNCKSKKILK